MFKIQDHIEFKNGRAQCPACLADGKTKPNLALVPGTDGAYKCHRGCTSEEIRAALGAPRDRQLPSAITPAPSVRSVTVPASRVEANHQALLKNPAALQWLVNRGLSLKAIGHYQLGLTRWRSGNRTLPAITIPIPSGQTGFYYQKKRIAPWINGDHPAWSQYGIPARVYKTWSPENPQRTFLCEGEWDAIQLGWELKQIGDRETEVACFTCGAGSIPPQEETDRLTKRVVTFYDLDEAGEKGSERLQERERERVLIARVPAPERHKQGWDVSDAIAVGHKLDEFYHAASTARPWTERRVERQSEAFKALLSQIKTNAELIDSAQEYQEWLVPDLLTENEFFIVAGPPRSGKSLFAMTLTHAVATGGLFLDRPTLKGSVLYVNCEDSPTKIRKRQEAQQWDKNLPVHWLEKFKLGQLPELREIAKGIPDLRLVILDTLSRVRDDRQKETSAELSQTLEALQEWAREESICVIALHHLSKNTGVAPTDPFDRIRGSSAIRATARGCLLLEPSDSYYRLISENGHTERLDLRIRINPQFWRIDLLGRWEPRMDGTLKGQILDHLALIEAATVQNLARELGRGSETVRRTLYELQRDQQVIVDGGRGKYTTYRLKCNLEEMRGQKSSHLRSNPEEDCDTGQMGEKIRKEKNVHILHIEEKCTHLNVQDVQILAGDHNSSHLTQKLDSERDTNEIGGDQTSHFVPGEQVRFWGGPGGTSSVGTVVESTDRGVRVQLSDERRIWIPVSLVIKPALE